MVVEEDLKAIMDAVSWTLGSQGVTKETYVRADSESKTLRLSPPMYERLENNNVVNVIERSNPTTRDEYTGADKIFYEGDMNVYARSKDDIDTALGLIKDIGDVNIGMRLLSDGPIRGPQNGTYQSTVRYEWLRVVVKN